MEGDYYPYCSCGEKNRHMCAVCVKCGKDLTIRPREQLPETSTFPTFGSSTLDAAFGKEDF